VPTDTTEAETPTATATPIACAGDCDGGGAVMINELVLGVNIALDQAALAECPAMNANGDLQVSVDELITAVNNALNGCP
jgi:hypothetical protein